MMLRMSPLGSAGNGAGVMKTMSANLKQFERKVQRTVDSQIKKAASYTKSHGQK
jgi:hypothetical protein